MTTSDAPGGPDGRSGAASGPEGERADLLEALGTQSTSSPHRRGPDRRQAAERTTASEADARRPRPEHVSAMETRWRDFVERGPAAVESGDPQEWVDGFRMPPGETLAELVDAFGATAARTNALVTSLPDLDVAQPLPTAPWFPPGATRSARRVFLHLVAEIAQHAGHADIIRESLDGQKTMG